MTTGQHGEVAPKDTAGPAAGWWGRNQRRLIPYLFIAPNMIVFTVFMFVPIVFAFYMSLTRVVAHRGSPCFIGLGNYVDMVQDADVLDGTPATPSSSPWARSRPA